MPDHGEAERERNLVLPDPLGRWVSALTLWPVIEERGYLLAVRRFAGGRGPDWTFFSSLLVHEGIVTPAREAETEFHFRDEWLPALERGLDELGGATAVREQLIDAWLDAPERSLLAPISLWAREFARWDVFERIWLLLGEQTHGLSEEVLRVIRDLPLEARRSRPILTWASGAAASLMSSAPRQETEAVLQRLMLDSAMLHADWSVREDTDEAVSAGTFRMIGERRLPSTRPGQSLEAAWRTKQEVDEFIDARSRAGRGPGRTPQAIFRAISARLALFRFDPVGAINEARWSTILADWEPIGVVAKGVEALAASLSSEEGPDHYSDPPLVGIDDNLGPRGLRGMGQIYEILADANEALRRLHREELERCLHLVAPVDAGLAGVWSVRISLAAWRSVLWGDVNAGLNELSAEVARLSLVGREQDEPLGDALLRRARVMQLTKAGAFAAANQVAEGMPERFGLLALARMHLWSGQYKQAVRIADAGPYQPGLDMAERYRLSLVRATSALLDGSADESLRGDAIREMRRLLGVGTFLDVALLPKAGRDALLELCEPEFEDDQAFALLRERLGQLNDSGGGGARALHLTERETILLPLLATDASVPDIARQLHVSVNTIRKQVVTLREKFDAESRAELVRRARTYGALP